MIRPSLDLALAMRGDISQSPLPVYPLQPSLWAWLVAVVHRHRRRVPHRRRHCLSSLAVIHRHRRRVPHRRRHCLSLSIVARRCPSLPAVVRRCSPLPTAVRRCRRVSRGVIAMLRDIHVVPETRIYRCYATSTTIDLSSSLRLRRFTISIRRPRLRSSLRSIPPRTVTRLRDLRRGADGHDGDTGTQPLVCRIDCLLSPPPCAPIRGRPPTGRLFCCRTWHVPDRSCPRSTTPPSRPLDRIDRICHPATYLGPVPCTAHPRTVHPRLARYTTPFP